MHLTAIGVSGEPGWERPSSKPVYVASSSCGCVVLVQKSTGGVSGNAT
jgi:hypothetical protein